MAYTLDEFVKNYDKIKEQMIKKMSEKQIVKPKKEAIQIETHVSRLLKVQ